MPRTPAPPRLADDEYELLAAFRHALRRFLHFSEDAAREAGLEAQHYQAMLAVRGAPAGTEVSMKDLAAQLFIRHHSAVGLVDRLQERGLMARATSPLDRRKVLLRLTGKGERVLERLAGAHRAELRRIGPGLVAQIARATAAGDDAPSSG